MLEVNCLVKKFASMTAVDQLSFTIPDGKILGLIGQNGAGKTTTFRLLLNFLTPDKGSILWDNHPITGAMLNTIGYLPEERGLYPKISIQEQLVYFAQLRGQKRKEILPKIDYWMDKFQVKGRKTDKVKTLSKGNQQKVQLIATLIHEPKLVILDEPFSGLDPVNAELLVQGILELKAQGACVIFSSHNMNNVERICDNLLMLHHGKTILNNQVHKIRSDYGRTRLTLATSAVSEAELKAVPGVIQVTTAVDGTFIIDLEEENVGRKIFQLVDKDRYIPVFSQQPPTLEEIFKLEVARNNG